MCFAPLSLRPERLRAGGSAAPLRWIARAIALQRSRESAVHVPERFRAVAPSAVLSKGLSPDSSYRDGGMIQNPIQKAQLTARSFRLPSHFDEFRDDCIAVIALNFNDAGAHCAAGSTALLELGGEHLDVGDRQRQPADRRHALTSPALRLPAHPDGRGLGSSWSAFGTHTFAYRAATIWAQAADTG
jgi:hypothetical protein